MRLGVSVVPPPLNSWDQERSVSCLKDNETVGAKMGVCLKDNETASHRY